MFVLNKDDNSIYATRGDIVFFSVTAEDEGKPYVFKAGDVVRIKVYGKKDAENVVLQKDFAVTDDATSVDIYLTKEDTKIGEVISKHKDYWYEIVVNDDTDPQTIIGYDEDGAKLFRLFPEGDDVEIPETNPEDIPVVDSELDMTSHRPIENQAVARAFEGLKEGYENVFDAVAKLHVTPQMFGAIGDGIADDTEAIQAAIDSFVGNAGAVFFPQGQYKITKPITIKSNVYLQGVSSAKYGRYNSDIPSTVIFYGGKETVESVIQYDRNGATVFGGGILNLTIDGQEKADYIINLCKSGRVAVANNAIVKSLKSGIYAASTYENIIKENWFGDNLGYAITLDTYANANVVRDNAIALASESCGILISGSNGNVVSGNMIEGGYGASIGINIAATMFTVQNVITENRIEFESHRYEGQTEGICIIIGAEGEAQKPKRNFVQRNSVFNQVVLTSGAMTEYNHKNEFVDYGMGTITDFYDHIVLNKNAKMVVSNGVLENFKYVDDGFSFSESDNGAKISLNGAVYEYPVVYQAVDARALRGEEIALSCMINCLDRAVSVGIEYYKGSTSETWGEFGENISAKRDLPFDLATDHLVQITDIVPEDCDMAVVVLNFGTGKGIPVDTEVDVKWCKLTRLATWK